MNPMQMPMMGMPPTNTMMLMKNYPTLYVGDLEENITEETLYNFFKQYGLIYSVRVMRDITYKRSRGFAFLTFYNQVDAQKAKEQTNHRAILQNPIRVTWNKNPRDISMEANVFVKNLDPTLTVDQLDSHFNQFGPIFSSKIAHDNAGNSLCYGYIQFENKESAERCIAENNVKIKDKAVTVSLFQGKKNREDSRKNLYIKNFLNSDNKESVLINLCREFGEVSSYIIKVDPSTQRPFAFVCYADNQSADQAFKGLSERDPFNSGEKLYVNWAEKKVDRIRKLRDIYSSSVNETNLFTKNLKLTVTKEQLVKAYEVFGEITKCDLRVPQENPNIPTKPNFKKTQFAYMNFRHKEDAKEALAKAKDNEVIQSLYEEPRKTGLDLYYHMKKDQYNLFKESKKRSRKIYQPPNMMMEGYPFMYPPPPVRNGPHQHFQRPDFYNMGNFMMPPFRQQMPNPNFNKNRGGYNAKRGFTGPQQGSHRGGPQGKRPMGKQNYPQGQQMPVQNQQTQPQPQSQAFTPQFLKENLNEFLKFDKEKQRGLLGEMIFPMIKKLCDNEDLAPKITGMLIDFEVFEVQEILEFIDSEELLKERVQEAVELINQSS